MEIQIELKGKNAISIPGQDRYQISPVIINQLTQLTNPNDENSRVDSSVVTLNLDRIFLLTFFCIAKVIYLYSLNFDCILIQEVYF